jgi:hypothetical protein
MATLLLKLSERDGRTIRGMMTNTEQFWSVYDFITRACDYKDTGATARKEFKRLIESEFKDEIVASCHSLHFPNQRGPATPCMTIRGLQRLLMILGGKVAAEFRKIVEGTFTRVMAGDQSLIEVINANAASDAPLQQAYRAALTHEHVSPVLDDLCLGQKRDRGESTRELELAERKLRLEEGEFRLKEREKALEHMNWGMELMDSLKSKSNIDERTKLQFEDHIKNVILSSTNSFKQKSITNGDSDAPIVNETESLNVSVLAKSMGYKCSDSQIINIGRAMAAMYREKYHCNPPKHKQFVKGNYVQVNSYMERDRPMMLKAIQKVIEGGDGESRSSLSD